MNRKRLSSCRNMVRKACEWGKTVLRTFLDNNCAMHAAGLTYYAMLALVPVLCVLLLLAKTFGADQYAKEKAHAWFEEHIQQFESAVAEPEASPEVGQPSPSGDDAAVAAMPAEGQADGADSAAGPAVAPLPSSSEGASDRRREATLEFVSQARSIESGLMERIDQFNVGTLGWVGLLMLVWTVVGSIGMVEVSFNEIWGVRRVRALWRRILLYLFVSFVLPILGGLALSVPLLKLAKDIIASTAGALWLTRWLSDGMIWILDSWALRMAITLFFATSVFTFVFKVLPNSRVPLRSAFWCGLVTALLFGSWFRLCAVAQVGIAKSSALYGSFAFLPIVLAWFYMSWQIVLLGCCMVRACFLHSQPTVPLSHSGDNSPSAI